MAATAQQQLGGSLLQMDELGELASRLDSVLRPPPATPLDVPAAVQEIFLDLAMAMMPHLDHASKATLMSVRKELGPCMSALVTSFSVQAPHAAKEARGDVLAAQLTRAARRFMGLRALQWCGPLASSTARTALCDSIRALRPTLSSVALRAPGSAEGSATLPVLAAVIQALADGPATGEPLALTLDCALAGMQAAAQAENDPLAAAVCRVALRLGTLALPHRDVCKQLLASEGAQPRLVRVLGSCSQLTSLQLSGSSTVAVTPEVLAALPPTLRHLTACLPDAGPEQQARVCSALSAAVSRGLSSLRLHACFRSEATVQRQLVELFGALRGVGAALRELGLVLRHKWMGTSGIDMLPLFEELSSLLRALSNLERLELSACSVGLRDWDARAKRFVHWQWQQQKQPFVSACAALEGCLDGAHQLRSLALSGGWPAAFLGAMLPKGIAGARLTHVSLGVSCDPSGHGDDGADSVRRVVKYTDREWTPDEEEDDDEYGQGGDKAAQDSEEEEEEDEALQPARPMSRVVECLSAYGQLRELNLRVADASGGTPSPYHTYRLEVLAGIGAAVERMPRLQALALRNGWHPRVLTSLAQGLGRCSKLCSLELARDDLVYGERLEEWQDGRIGSLRFQREYDDALELLVSALLELPALARFVVKRFPLGQQAVGVLATALAGEAGVGPPQGSPGQGAGPSTAARSGLGGGTFKPAAAACTRLAALRALHLSAGPGLDAAGLQQLVGACASGSRMHALEELCVSYVGRGVLTMGQQAQLACTWLASPHLTQRSARLLLSLGRATKLSLTCSSLPPCAPRVVLPGFSVEELKATGAKLLTTGSVTPLHSAAWLGCARSVSCLLAEGADPNALDTDGRTPLHYAAAVGNEATTRVLLEAGAKLTADKHGLTPVHTAAGASNGNPLTSVVAAATEALSALEKLHQLRGCRQEQAVAVLRCLTLLHHTRPRLAVAAGAPSAAEGAGSVQTRSSGLRAYDSDSASGCGEDSSDDDSDGARGMAWLPRFHRKCWAVYRRRRVVRVTARKSMRYPPQLYSER